MTDYPPYIDRRDEEVVKRLEVGEQYGVTLIKDAYKRFTDIRQDRTAKQRKDNLVNSPCFENTGIGVFRFVGFDDDGEVLPTHD